MDCGGGLTILAPRQKLGDIPYAVYSGSTRWGGLLDVPAGFADNVDNDTTYTAGPGLLLIGTTFAPDTTFLQKRVAQACAAGSSIRAISSTGGITCEPDTDTQYSAGSGLILIGTTFSADTTFLQRRVAPTCAAGSSIRAISSTGGVTCEPDDTGITSETDPKVGTLSLNSVPKWNGSSLVTGAIFDSGTVGISQHGDGAGFVETRGPNGNVNVRITRLFGNANYGRVSVGDSSGT